MRPHSHGARPVHLIITIIKWIQTSRLSIKNSLSSAPHALRCRERICNICHSQNQILALAFRGGILTTFLSCCHFARKRPLSHLLERRHACVGIATGLATICILSHPRCLFPLSRCTQALRSLHPRRVPLSARELHQDDAAVPRRARI